MKRLITALVYTVTALAFTYAAFWLINSTIEIVRGNHFGIGTEKQKNGTDQKGN